MRAVLLQTGPLDVSAHMAMDEAVLESGGAGDCVLRFFEWAGTPPYGATFGYSQRHEAVAAAAALRWPGRQVPLTRRSTGGGIVFHDGDVTFSLVFPWPEVSPPVFVYREIHMAVHLGLKAHGLWSRLWKAGAAPEGGGGPRAECFSGPEPEDLVDGGGGKVLGGALRRRRGRGLYQGSLRPEGFGVSRERITRAVLEGFSLQKGTLFVPREPAPATAAEAQRLRAERYAADEWNKKR